MAGRNRNEAQSRAVCKYYCLRLPFISYHRGNFYFYLGWRNRGNFGFEFKFAKPKAEWLRENERKQPRADAEGGDPLDRHVNSLAE